MLNNHNFFYRQYKLLLLSISANQSLSRATGDFFSLLKEGFLGPKMYEGRRVHLPKDDQQFGIGNTGQRSLKEVPKQPHF